MSDTAPLQTYHVWKQAWRAFLDLKRPIFIVMAAFIAIPQLASEWFLAGEYQKQLASLNQILNRGSLTVLELIEVLTSGMFQLILILILNFLLFGLAYILIVRYGYEQLQSKPPKKLKEHLGPAIRKFPKTVVILTIIFFLYLLVQSTIPPLILILAPVIMAPVIFVLEKKSLFGSLGDSASLRFLKESKLPKLSIYFILLGYIGFLILTLYISVWLSDKFLNFDIWLPYGFSFINSAVMGVPFSAAHMIFEVFFVGILSLAMSYFILLKVCFYYFIKTESIRLPEGGLQA